MGLFKTRERDVQAAAIEFFKLRGILYVRVNCGAIKAGKRFVRFTSRRGVSDVLACIRGRFVAFEFKRPGGKPTIDQREFLDDVGRAGGVAFVCQSIDDVIEAVDSLMKSAGHLGGNERPADS